jgi:hypothetical protein
MTQANLLDPIEAPMTLLSGACVPKVPELEAKVVAPVPTMNELAKTAQRARARANFNFLVMIPP